LGNVAFNTTFKSIQNVLYTVKIHDYVGGLTAFTREMSLHDIFIETRGDDRDIVDNIKPARAGFKFYVLDAYTEALREALIDSAEGRFYLEIMQDTDRLFMGRVIGNSYQQSDEKQPEVKIEAIDGLTLLKAKDYIHPSTDTGLSNLKDIVLECITQIDTIDRYYTNSENVLVFASNLQNKTGQDLLQTTYHNNYYYEENNEIKKRYSCYQILEEICKKYYLRLHYQNGLYILQGKETLYSTTPTYSVYQKNNVAGTITLPQNSYDLTDDVTSRMLAGGTFYYEPGYRKTIINVSKYHINKNLADGIYWRYGDTGYKEINQLIADTDYLAKIKIRLSLPRSILSNATVSTIYYVMLRIWFKRTGDSITRYDYVDENYSPFNHDLEVSTSVTTITAPSSSTAENYTDILLPFSVLRNVDVYDLFLYFPLDSVIEDTTMSFKANLINFYDGGNQIVSPIPSAYNCYTISMDLGIDPIEKADKDLFFEATADGSEETETKEINILASDQYGSALARTYTKITSGGTFEVSENQWRFGTSGGYMALERLLVKTIMGMLKAKQMFFQGSFYRRGNFPELTDVIEYRGYEWIIATKSWDVLNEIVNISLIKVGTIDTGVTVNEDEPVLIPDFPSTDILDPLSPAGGTESYYEDWEGVTDSHVTITEDAEIYFPDDVTKVKGRCRVYVDGIKYKYIDYTTITDPPAVGELQPNEYSYSITDNALYFPYELSGSYVEFYYLKA
jgi:hypothetical protein